MKVALLIGLFVIAPAILFSLVLGCNRLMK